MPQAAGRTYKTTSNGFIDHTAYTGASDEALIKDVLEGQTRLFEVLMRRYNQRLFRIIRSYLDDREEVKDAMQSAWLKAFENLEQFRGDAAFSTWLIRIGINEALKQQNRNGRRQSQLYSIHSESFNGQLASSMENPEHRTVNTDLKDLLEEVISCLPPKYRAVYLMREIEEMDTRETAECLELTESNVKVRLHRARQMLRDELEKRVADADVFSFLGADCDAMVKGVMEIIRNT